MKVFQTLTNHYATLGIKPSDQLQQQYPFDEKVLMGFSLWGCMITSHFIYINYVANTYVEYAECICTSTGSIIVFVCYASVVFYSNTLFDAFKKIEGFIASSEKKFHLQLYYNKIL